MAAKRCKGSLMNTPRSSKVTPCPECGFKQLPTRSGKVPIHKEQSLPRPPLEQYHSTYESCHRCDRPMTAALPCVDPVTDDEYDHHLDEPIGAGL